MKIWYFALLPFFFFTLPLQAAILPVSRFSGINSDASPLTLTNGQTPDSVNVVTDLDPGVQGRKGFLLFSTESSRGLWSFAKSDGTKYLITVSSNIVKAGTSGNFSVAITTIATSVTTYGAQLGDKFFFVNTIDGLQSWDGTTYSMVDHTMLADKICAFKGRLVVGNKTGNARLLYLSKYLDGTNFTLATNPSTDDPSQITVSGSLDEGIEGLYPFQDKLIIFKPNSFSGLYGSNRSNFILRTFSDFVGLSGVESIQDCDGKLRWLSRGRKVFEFDGSTFHKISEDVDTLFGTIAQGDSASRSITLTTQSDWQAGSIVPSGYLSVSNSPGDVVLSTMPAGNFTDDTSVEFSSGTFSQAVYDSTSSVVVLDLQSYNVYKDTIATVVTALQLNCSGPYYIAQQFVASSSYVITGVRAYSLVHGSPGTFTLNIYSDSSNTPGTLLTTKTGNAFSPAAVDSYSTFILDPSYNVLLSSGSKYWIQFVPEGLCNAGNYAEVGTQDGSFTTYASILGSGFLTTFRHDMTVLGGTYYSSGNFLSQTFDLGMSTTGWLVDWKNFLAVYSTNTQTLTFQTQSSSDNVTFSSLVSVSTGSKPTSAINRYFRYKANLSTTNPGKSPTLSSATMQTTPFTRSSGTFTTALINPGTMVTSWAPISISNNQSSGTIVYQFGSTTTASVSAITNWQTILHGGIPTVAVNPYIAVRATFTATLAGADVALHDISINWNEGSSIKSASIYPNQRYWLSTSISSTANNTILVYDKSNQWQKYSGINATAMTMHNSKPYFGNSAGIYEAENGYNDNGMSISAYYKTPSLSPAGLDIITNYRQIYMTTDNSDSTLATSYQIDGGTVSYTMGSRQMNTTGGIQNFKLPFSFSEVQLGRYVSFQWTVAGTTFWRILNGNIYYTPGLEPE